MDILEDLYKKSDYICKQVLDIHIKLPETRIASALSCIEILSALYYGKILNVYPRDPKWEDRDRLIVSKSHGAIPLYPILCDLKFFPESLLKALGEKGTNFSIIPDPCTPGVETVNGSLGHGIGVAIGISMALRLKKNNAKTFVLMGDGELSEGSVWESFAFASTHSLDNLNVIIDCNKKSMLSNCNSFFDLESLNKKMQAFGWDVFEVDGHNLDELYPLLVKIKSESNKRPKVIIAHTVKGKGFEKLENSDICHVLSLSKEEIELGNS